MARAFNAQSEQGVVFKFFQLPNSQCGAYSLHWYKHQCYCVGDCMLQILFSSPYGGYNEYSYCNLFWRLDKICYFYKSHYTIITGACGLYWNQMLCERLAGRTGILLRKTQGDFMVQSFKAE